MNEIGETALALTPTLSPREREKDIRLLAIVDSPTENTGFAGVAKALLPRWTPHCARLDVWGINYEGWPHTLPWRIFPGGRDWTDASRIERLLNMILDGDYTHVWILQDTFQFGNGLAQNLKLACADQKDPAGNIIKAGPELIVYYPVDAPLDKGWLNIARAADVAVTYTHYGAEESRRADPRVQPLVIPHGVDTQVFCPLLDSHSLTCSPAHLPSEESGKVGKWESERLKLREHVFGDWAQPEDFIIVNVNRNERRKAMVGCLQVLAELKKRERQGNLEPSNHRTIEPSNADAAPVQGSKFKVQGSTVAPRYKLFLHTPVKNHPEGVDLQTVGRQLGLVYGEDWLATPEDMFGGGVGRMTEAQINALYNASDLCLTTSLGEGWGLSITEAAAAGLPVVCPDHTSCGEIGRMFEKLGSPLGNPPLTPPRRGRQIWLAPLAGSGVVNTSDNSRVRWPVDIGKTADIIEEIWRERQRASGILPEDQTKNQNPPMTPPRRGDAGSTFRFPALDGAVKDWLSWDRIAAAWLEVFYAVAQKANAEKLKN